MNNQESEAGGKEALQIFCQYKDKHQASVESNFWKGECVLFVVWWICGWCQWCRGAAYWYYRYRCLARCALLSSRILSCTFFEERVVLFRSQCYMLDTPKESALLLLGNIMLWQTGVFGWQQNVMLKGEDRIRTGTGPFGLGEEQRGKATCMM